MQLALRALQEPGKAGALAVSMGLSDSTVSRIKTERLEEVLTFLAYLGIKAVPSEYQCVDPKTFAAFEVLYAKAMSQTTPATLTDFRIGEQILNGKTYAVFPFLDEAGNLINAKYRNPDDKRDMRQEAGTAPCLFGWHLIDPKARAVTISGVVGRGHALQETI